MKILPIAAFIAALLAAAPALTPLASAGTGIQLCQNGDGSAIYTDRACGSLGARALPMPGELLSRIARDEAAHSLGADASADAPPANAIVGRRSILDGCARTAAQLSMDLQGSFILRDVNRLAESYHWVGQSHQQAQRLMLRLERLAAKPLLDAHFFDAQIGRGGMQLADAGSGNRGASVMQLTFGPDSSPQVVDFEVLRYAGCYFVHF